MTLVSHPCFRLPEDLDTSIWRYMSFAKFVAMLEGESLFFTRADRQDDRFECLPPKAFLEQTERTLKLVDSDGDEKFSECVREQIKLLRCSVGVNCWHCGQHESTAMWKLYGSSHGIAVRSTVRRLCDALKQSDERAMVGLVGYGDDAYGDLQTHNNNLDLCHWILHKRQCFAHENELRAVIGDGLQVPSRSEFPKPGRPLQLPIQQLIDSVFVAPEASSWHVDLIRLVCKWYDFAVKIEPSSLDERPPKWLES